MIDGKEQYRTWGSDLQTGFDEFFEGFIETEGDFFESTEAGGIADDRVELSVILDAAVQIFEYIFGDEAVTVEGNIVEFEVGTTAAQGGRCRIDARRGSDGGGFGGTDGKSAGVGEEIEDISVGMFANPCAV